MVRRLQPTYRHPEAQGYRAPGGPWDPPSLDGLLSAAAVAAGSRLVLGDDTSGIVLDGTALEEQVARLAGGLHSLGVRRGDVVSWQAPNGVEVVVLYRACWRIGAVAAPIHHPAGASDVERMLGILQPRLWLGGPDDRARPHALAAGVSPITVSGA